MPQDRYGLANLRVAPGAGRRRRRGVGRLLQQANDPRMVHEDFGTNLSRVKVAPVAPEPALADASMQAQEPMTEPPRQVPRRPI